MLPLYSLFVLAQEKYSSILAFCDEFLGEFHVEIAKTIDEFD